MKVTTTTSTLGVLLFFSAVCFALNSPRVIHHRLGIGNFTSAEQGWPLRHLDYHRELLYLPDGSPVVHDGKFPVATHDERLVFNCLFCVSMSIIASSLTAVIWKRSYRFQRICFAGLMLGWLIVNTITFPRYSSRTRGFNGVRQGIPWEIAAAETNPLNPLRNSFFWGQPFSSRLRLCYLYERSIAYNLALGAISFSAILYSIGRLRGNFNESTNGAGSYASCHPPSIDNCRFPPIIPIHYQQILNTLDH